MNIHFNRSTIFNERLVTSLFQCVETYIYIYIYRIKKIAINSAISIFRTRMTTTFVSRGRGPVHSEGSFIVGRMRVS